MAADTPSRGEGGGGNGGKYNTAAIGTSWLTASACGTTVIVVVVVGRCFFVLVADVLRLFHPIGFSASASDAPFSCPSSASSVRLLASVFFSVFRKEEAKEEHGKTSVVPSGERAGEGHAATAGKQEEEEEEEEEPVVSCVVPRVFRAVGHTHQSTSPRN